MVLRQGRIISLCFRLVLLVVGNIIEYPAASTLLVWDRVMSILKPVYLDNAATSHPKPETVYRAVAERLRYGGTHGRGSHQQAIAADRVVFETREILCELFNGQDSSRFIFTPNATTAINQALFGLLQPGDRVVTTSMEHNAVVRPLRQLEDRGVSVVKVGGDPHNGRIDLAALRQACLEKTTRLLVVNHCSNVTGAILPLTGLGAWCREHNIVFMVDGAQSAGSLALDLQALDIDLFAAPGHKGLLGPQGTGFLYVREGLELNPLIFGGTGANSHSDRQPVDLPEQLESGTLNLPGLAGLHAAGQYLLQVGIDNIRQREIELTSRLLAGLNAIAGIALYGPELSVERGSVISFNLLSCDPAEVGFMLDRQQQISLRTGLHCAPDAHRTIGTLPEGTVRVSPGYFTTDAEVDYFLDAVFALAQQKPS